MALTSAYSQFFLNYAELYQPVSFLYSAFGFSPIRGLKSYFPQTFPTPKRVLFARHLQLSDLSKRGWMEGAAHWGLLDTLGTSRRVSEASQIGVQPGRCV